MGRHRWIAPVVIVLLAGLLIGPVYFSFTTLVRFLMIAQCAFALVMMAFVMVIRHRDTFRTESELLPRHILVVATGTTILMVVSAARVMEALIYRQPPNYYAPFICIAFVLLDYGLYIVLRVTVQKKETRARFMSQMKQ